MKNFGSAQPKVADKNKASDKRMKRDEHYAIMDRTPDVAALLIEMLISGRKTGEGYTCCWIKPILNLVFAIGFDGF